MLPDVERKASKGNAGGQIYMRMAEKLNSNKRVVF